MKKRTLCTLSALWLLSFGISNIHGQVTVGSGNPANAGAILDIKQYDDETAKKGGRTAEKGFMLPRLELTDLNSLDDIDPTNTTNRPDPKAHVGLVIYNLTDNTATGGVLKEGTYMWDGEAWQRIGLRDAQGYGPWYKIDDPNLPSRHVDEDSFLEARVVVGGRLILDDADLSVHGKSILKGGATVGTDTKPTLGALLDVKSEQAKVTTDPNSDDNITSTKGGLLLPRVKLQGTATLKPFLTAAEETPEAQAALTGLMVYNINGTPPLETGIYTWDGELWLTAGFTKTAQSMTIAVQPKEFSFYETGEETPEPLEFKVNPPVHIDGSVGTVTYQWYQLTGSNLHARIGTPISGATSANYIPNSAFKTTNGSKSTRYAQNNGMTRYYCEAKSSDGIKLTSSIVEVVVGCGAKNNLGEWISFMCHNLGAQNGITIQEQKDYAIGTFSNDGSGVHTYINGEENLWGDLYQWGRVADGHQNRQSATKAIGDGTDLTANIGNGYYCTRDGNGNRNGNPYPYYQVKKGTDWYSKFITSNVTHDFNWYPITATASAIDQLWRNGRFVANDPCAKYKADGTMVEAWTSQDVPAGNNARNPDIACQESGTGWRTPMQEEYGAIYKGGAIAGSPANASANTWNWYNGTTSNYSRGYEVKPDGSTTTLFLPASGNRHNGNGLLYSQGSNANYCTSSIVGTNAYALNFNNGSVNPAISNNRAYGFALRCIKN